MIPAPPFWMMQRQVKTEPRGEDALRLRAPQLPIYEIVVQPTDSAGWSGRLYRLPSAEGAGELVVESESFSDARRAWEAAYELYRRRVIT